MPGKLLRQDVLGGLVVIAVALFAYWTARHLPTGTGGAMGPGALPKGLAVLLGLLGVGLLVGAFLEKGEGLARWSIRGPLFVLGAIVLFGVSVRPLGLAVAGPLAIAGAAFASSDSRWGETLAFGVLMTLFCAGLFKFALGLPIPLAPWLLGY